MELSLSLITSSTTNNISRFLIIIKFNPLYSINSTVIKVLIAGNNYYAPIQLVGDFLEDSVSTKIGSVKPTYLPGYRFVKLSDILPNYVTDTLKEALIDFDHKIKGFEMADAVLTGVETRSSSPIRILRNEEGMSNIKGIYPMGEGAGYAGGIMSSAVDGLKQVERLIKVYCS